MTERVTTDDIRCGSKLDARSRSEITAHDVTGRRKVHYPRNAKCEMHNFLAFHVSKGSSMLPRL